MLHEQTPRHTPAPDLARALELRLAATIRRATCSSDLDPDELAAGVARLLAWKPAYAPKRAR